MLNKLVSNEDAGEVGANQSGHGGCTAQRRRRALAELTDTEDAVTASSSGFWEAGRVNIIKLHTDLGHEDLDTCY